jgi:hypothetical protein
MFDRFVAIGSELDWITPVLTWLTDMRSGGSVGYNIPVDAGWSALAIQMMLHEAGVRIWGLSIVAGIITFRLKRSQARYAQYLLERNGIPYQGGMDITSSKSKEHQRQSSLRSAPSDGLLNRTIAPIHQLVQKLQRL